jgi:type VI secretion system secreted protein VgrG
MAAISTSLGEDVLLLKSFSTAEQLGRLFQFEAELLSEEHEIKFEDIVGQNATVRLNLPEGECRYFNGYINRFVQSPSQGDFARYQATLVPWLWFLTRNADCRIFKEMTAPEIIEQVFRDQGFTDFKNSLSGGYCTREFCVQYRQSDFEFVSQLMEQEGIYYFFAHENGKHTLVLADSKSAHATFPGYETIPHRYLDQPGVDQQYIFDWVVEQQVQSGVVCLNDFDFEKPRKALLVKANVTRPHAVPNYEVYDYPGRYVEYSDGEGYARRRIEELQAQHELVHAQSRARGVCAGFLFKLEGHPREDQNREYLVTSTHCQIINDRYETAPRGKTEEFFSCRLSALNSDTPFRSARLTAKPVIQGPQTAVVVGPQGEEIYTDKYGRVKVQFHWDRRSTADENSSCWLRVSQSAAGKNWGALSLPRVGQEVVVEFLEGDPDRPIITGRVYNGESMPPYALPGQKTLTTFKSNSSKGGKGFNEIRIEDKKGSEQIFIHGEMNQDVRIKNDAREFIGNERHLIVKKNQLEKVEGDQHSIVKGDHLSKTEGDRGDTIKGDRLTAIDGTDHLTVKTDQKIKVGGDQSLNVGGNWNNEVSQKLSIKSGQDFHEKAGMNYAMEAGMNVHIKGGMTVVVEAGMQLSLKAGSSFIDIGPAGVAIQGTMVMINSGGAAASGSGSSPTAPAAPDSPTAPKEANEAADAKPGDVDKPPLAPKPPKPVTYSASAQVLQSAAQNGTPFCEKCEEARRQREAAGSA